jgi:hypothetical protein
MEVDDIIQAFGKGTQTLRREAQKHIREWI